MRAPRQEFSSGPAFRKQERFTLCVCEEKRNLLLTDRDVCAAPWDQWEIGSRLQEGTARQWLRLGEKKSIIIKINYLSSPLHLDLSAGEDGFAALRKGVEENWSSFRAAVKKPEVAVWGRLHRELWEPCP